MFFHVGSLYGMDTDVSTVSPYLSVAEGTRTASVATWFLVPLQLIVGAVALAAVTWLLATVMRRVLGVPVGWPRSIVVALVVSLATGGLVYLAIDQFWDSGVEPGPAVILGGIALLWMLGFGAAVLTVLELIAPTGATGGSPLSWFSGLRDARGRNRRYRQVTAVFVRRGLTSGRPSFSGKDADVTRRIAQSFREALEECGTTFVKLGQNLSTRENNLPPEFISELSQLQTSASPAPWSEIREALTEALGAAPEEVFASVEHEPMAAASVAQVHRATLEDGTAVVLKIQRPGVVEEVTRDTDIVLRVCTRLENSAQWARDMRLKQLASSFTTTLAEELDYRTEATNMRQMAEPVAATGMVMPKVYGEFSSRRLLVMDELVGTPLGSATGPDGEIAAMTPELRRELGDLLMSASLRQMMRYGVFQADPHPGNVLVMHDVTVRSASSSESEHSLGRLHVTAGSDEETVTTRETGLGMLDFGAVGRLDSTDRTALAAVFAAIDLGDARVLTDALLGLMDRPEELDIRALQRSVSALLSRYGGGIGYGEGAALFSQLTRLFNDYRLVVPETIAVALRSLAELEGTLRVLDPGYPLVETARREGSDLVKDRFRPGGLKDAAESVLMESLPLLRDLPRQVSGIVGDLQNGRMSVSMRMFRNPGDRAFLTGLLQQITVAMVAGFCVLGGVMLIAFGDGGPKLVDELTWHAAMGYVVLFAGFLLSLRTVAMVLFRGRGGRR
jgi:ubiquinone biosynthesis protein